MIEQESWAQREAQLVARARAAEAGLKRATEELAAMKHPREGAVARPARSWRGGADGTGFGCCTICGLSQVSCRRFTS